MFACPICTVSGGRYEARDRIGGRVHTLGATAGFSRPVDVGAATLQGVARFSGDGQSDAHGKANANGKANGKADSKTDGKIDANGAALRSCDDLAPGRLCHPLEALCRQHGLRLLATATTHPLSGAHMIFDRDGRSLGRVDEPNSTAAEIALDLADVDAWLHSARFRHLSGNRDVPVQMGLDVRNHTYGFVLNLRIIANSPCQCLRTCRGSEIHLELVVCFSCAIFMRAPTEYLVLLNIRCWRGA